MGLRPNNCYRRMERSYTRSASRVQKKDFLGGIPGVRTRQFVMGDQTKKFDWEIDMIALENCQVRDNAIEAYRQKLVRELSLALGKDNWVVKIRMYPYHILRENKAASGAGADRVSSGMKHSFGKNIGRAVQVRNKDILLSVVVNKDGLKAAETALKRAKYKLNLEFELKTHKHENMMLSGRKKWTRESKLAKVEETPAKDAKAAATPAAPAKGGKGGAKGAAPAAPAAPAKGGKAAPAAKGGKK